MIKLRTCVGLVVLRRTLSRVMQRQLRHAAFRFRPSARTSESSIVIEARPSKLRVHAAWPSQTGLAPCGLLHRPQWNSETKEKHRFPPNSNPKVPIAAALLVLPGISLPCWSVGIRHPCWLPKLLHGLQSSYTLGLHIAGRGVRRQLQAGGPRRIAFPQTPCAAREKSSRSCQWKLQPP